MDVNVVKNLQNTQCETKQFSFETKFEPSNQNSKVFKNSLLTITAAALAAAALALDCQR